MSCNGCRVLRKGCNEKCILRESLRGIESPQAQGNAMLFVAKFFGRAGLVSFLSAVPDSQRSALFQSLLFEACGRTVNAVSGAVGLLWTGNWQICETAVETVLRGDVLRPIPTFSVGSAAEEFDDASETNNIHFLGSLDLRSDRANDFRELTARAESAADLDLCLTAGGRGIRRREETPSMDPEESKPTTFESGLTYRRSLQGRSEAKLLRLF
ncbi:LOB domain-containing protein 37-like [Actinidia eriantha]|uniref:LOB domain-containing protein 37-like n=1 Tax=Actinidia eriantha TaxID=165200 RepID=UPI00258860B3|nr:LOB domain-containing protein 37-like [Actinidia eriantha]